MRAHSPAGFTLVEVLVALFVLSVGLLGAAAMQAKARALHTDAAMYSNALLIAISLAERMRANPVAMSVADASNPYLQMDIDSRAPPTPAPPCFGDANCTPSGLAAFDAYETARALRDALPGAHLLVCRDGGHAADLLWDCDAVSGAPVVIKLGWRSRHGAGGTSDFPPAFVLPVGGGGA